MRIHLGVVIWIGLLATVLQGCGYQMAGRGDLPGGVQTLSVRILENRSSETGAEIWVTNALIGELSRRRQGSVVDAQHAEATLSGAIESLTWDTVTRKGLNTAAERRVVATVSLTLTDTREKLSGSAAGLRAEQAYVVVEGNKPATDNNRRNAIRELSVQRIAENAYRRLTEQF